MLIGNYFNNLHGVWGQVIVPEQLQKELKAAMEKAGIPVPETEERWQQALAALKVALQASHFSCSHTSHVGCSLLIVTAWLNGRSPETVDRGQHLKHLLTF